MDFFSSTRILEWIAHKRAEHYIDNPSALPPPALKQAAEVVNTTSGPVANKPQFTVFSIGGLVSLAVGIVIGIVAAYLSWSCNTAMQYNFGLKVFFAFFAYLFGLVYLILYIIMRYDTCAYIKKTNYF